MPSPAPRRPAEALQAAFRWRRQIGVVRQSGKAFDAPCHPVDKPRKPDGVGCLHQHRVARLKLCKQRFDGAVRSELFGNQVKHSTPPATRSTSLASPTELDAFTSTASPG